MNRDRMNENTLRLAAHLEDQPEGHETTMTADKIIALLDNSPAYRESMIDKVFPEAGEDQVMRQWAATALKLLAILGESPLWMRAAAADHMADCTQDGEKREALRALAEDMLAQAAAAGELRS